MVTITYVEHQGHAHVVRVPAGSTVMEGARNNGIPGIVAECGGACACATCHVYIATEWISRLPKKGSAEEEMLEFACAPDPARSRLSCQIKATPSLDGLVVCLPERQN